MGRPAEAMGEALSRMLEAVFSGFAFSLAAPPLTRYLKPYAGWLIALLPLGLFLYFSSLLPQLVDGEVFTASYEWVPTLDVSLAFYLDGLSLVFILLITGIGAVVVMYAGAYLADDPQLDVFYMYILVFMASMLGVVLADNLITLFVFWELTSISSYLLIGYKHEKAASRTAALQALLVTGSGGLALLAGLIVLGTIAGDYQISALAASADQIQADSLYAGALVLILLGAFTKSAQFPFHFWLPGAMEAPTPVSAYLHSATMVKAGVYLLARLQPALGGTAEWITLVTGVGALTLLVGAFLSWQQRDLKRILAYSTVGALGMLVMLLGIDNELAAKGAIVLLIAHSLYKGALFLVAGIIDHETGTRDVMLLGGLARKMPVTALAAILAASSMAGLPPLLGFISKEVLYEATLEMDSLAWLVTGVALVGNVFMVAASGLVAIRPFFGAEGHPPKRPHEAPLAMWIGPLLLGILGLAAGALPSLTAEHLVGPATKAVLQESYKVKLVLYKGVNAMLILSAITIASGAAVYAWREMLHGWLGRLDVGIQVGPARGYRILVDGLPGTAAAITKVLQNGYLRYYLMTIIAVTVSLVGYVVLSRLDMGRAWRTPDVRFYELLIAAIILLAALMVTLTQSRMTAVAGLGVVGYSIALLYMMHGAPDLAMTQFAIETLTVVLFVLVIYRLPRFVNFSSGRARLRDALFALTAGGMMTLLVLLITADPLTSKLTPYFAENSYPLANGRNIVNVILVDFRQLDTFGEIVVLTVASIGVYSLLKLRLMRHDES